MFWGLPFKFFAATNRQRKKLLYHLKELSLFTKGFINTQIPGFDIEKNAVLWKVLDVRGDGNCWIYDTILFAYYCSSDRMSFRHIRDWYSDSHLIPILQTLDAFTPNPPGDSSKLGIYLQQDILGMQFLWIFYMDANNALCKLLHWRTKGFQNPFPRYRQYWSRHQEAKHTPDRTRRSSKCLCQYATNSVLCSKIYMRKHTQALECVQACG